MHIGGALLGGFDCGPLGTGRAGGLRKRRSVRFDQQGGGEGERGNRHIGGV